jgi:hypothetical protein
MIVFAREVFVCKCATDVQDDDPDASELSRKMRFVKGGEKEIAALDPEHHNAEHVADFRARLARGEHWMVGFADDRIVTYTWLHARATCEYPYLPGCAFNLAPDVGYGYDAWTPPDLRGAGLRRRAFLEELHILKRLGKNWEASYFVKHQLEGATRSLSKVGIVILPLWRVTIKAASGTKELVAEKLSADDSTSPAFGNITA